MLAMGRMAVRPVVPVSMDIKGCQDRRKAIHAADAHRGRNDEKAQKLASQMAHNQEKPKDSNAVKPYSRRLIDPFGKGRNAPCCINA